MNKSHNPQGATRPNGVAPKNFVPDPDTDTRKSRLGGGKIAARTARLLTYGLGFLAFFAFLSFVYGDVLARAQQDSYISTSADTLYYLTSQSCGEVYSYFRWGLLLFKWPLLGGALLALIFTLTARLADYALCLPRKWEGLGFVAAAAQTGWMIYRGTNLYYKNEPSLFLVIACSVLAASAAAAGIVWLLRRKRAARAVTAPLRPWSLVFALGLPACATWAAYHFNENVMLTARLQLLTQEGRWDDIIEEARTASRPSRAVAAYHAIALLQTDRLLEGMFDIPYDFPKERLEKHDGSEEYGIFLADCNYYAGLLNPGYRCAMDHTVMNGPRLYALKQMAACALLNGEKALCRKYLTIIERNPFESKFTERYRQLLNEPQRIQEDENLKSILSRYPREDRFEQNYRSPAFLGYNVGLAQGSDATLITSAAACLYSKDLQSFLPRAEIMARKGLSFPQCMQEAIAIMAMKQPELLKAFPQVGRFVPDQITSFLMDAKPYAKDRLALRRELRDRWLGSYAYYYYAENNDPDQVEKPSTDTHNAGVN